METVIKGLADLLLVGGTVGGYAMIIIIMLIVGWFKYFKPFLSDFNKIKLDIETFIKNHKKLNVLGDDIISKLNRVIEITNKEHIDLRRDITTNQREHQVELLNLIRALNKEIDVLSSKISSETDRNDENFKTLTIEIAKLQTRLEFLHTPGARGIQK